MSRKDKSLDKIKFTRKGTLQEISPVFLEETSLQETLKKNFFKRRDF